ncbi:MAG: glutamine-hydrolyzing carbamoyl-phosphate synthase small subunit [Ignavibacteriaceae bacterium]|nr:glutamine-hydrolyzing carbamoyl-phosphate synthase small subunit [Ignavibacteriaceae bacterium]
MKAKIVLQDGTVAEGTGFGYAASVNGEAVFNTGMVGYPETLTDPSYCGQILIFTYPLIGNYGVPGYETENGLLKNFESDKIQARGVVLSDLSLEHSHWSAIKTLDEWMKEQKIPGVYGVDTRMLTRKLREAGTMPGKILFEGKKDVEFEDPNLLDLVSRVAVTEPVTYQKGEKRVTLVDCGVKNNIIQAFLRRGITVTRVPYDSDFLTIEADGIVLSNGPGDPKMCVSTIENAKRAMARGVPILGICLGCQILGLAAGADTYKLKYGHRSHNQPVNEAGTKRTYITSQNHGYAINSNTLSQDWREWFTNDNDGTNEGIIHISRPFFGAQFHPEASPGPDDTEFIFDMFVRALR